MSHNGIELSVVVPTFNKKEDVHEFVRRLHGARRGQAWEMIERLHGKGYELRLSDRNVQLASRVGANRDYIWNRSPHISRLMVDSVVEFLDFAEKVVIGNGAKEFQGAVNRLRDGRRLVDLVRIGSELRSDSGRYDGIY